MILENVDRYRVVEPLYEGIRVIMNYRGESFSPAYIQGISGAAFHVGGICPCAPTCTPGIEPLELIRLLGYEAEPLRLYTDQHWDQPAPESLLNEFIERIKKDIRHNRPVLVWHAFTMAEWDVVAGYNKGRQVFLGRGSYMGLDGYAEAAWTRPRDSLEICPAEGAIFIGEKTGKFNASEAEINSLREAVSHANSSRNVENISGAEWTFLDGLRAYERWANEFTTDPQKPRTSGDAYCYGVYRSTHRAAGNYLAELAQKYPQAGDRLLQAASCFTAEAEILDQAENLLWWNSPEGVDAQRNQEAGRVLVEACSLYRQGIEGIEIVLKVL